MELSEFVRLDPDKIRRDKELMQLFVKFYEAAFSFLPSCVGCSFKSGFRKLKQYSNGNVKIVNFDKNNKMEAKTFLLKNQFKLKILSYKKDGKMYRTYGYNMTEDFARELVKAGHGEVFSKPPMGAKEIVSKKYGDMDYFKEIVPLYNEIKDRTGKSANGKKKADIIEFLEKYEG